VRAERRGAVAGFACNIDGDLPLKTRTIIAALFLVAVIIVTLFWLATSRRHVSVLVVNANIYTLDDAVPRAEAIAVDGDRIIAVGSTADLTDRYTADTTLDLRGKTVFPGFIDSHAHMEGLGLAMMTLNLAGTTSVREIQDKLAEWLSSRPESLWVRGRGWDQTKWAAPVFPTHKMLDSISVRVPIVLVRIDGHAAWVNHRALTLAAITARTPDPPGGKILRAHDGNPTGVLLDNAIDLVRAVMPPLSRGERGEALLRASAECVKMGLTEVHDMGVDLEQIGIYKEMMGEGRLPLRIYAAIDGAGPTWEHYMKIGPEVGLHAGYLSVRALKLYADGALGSRGAALIEPYSDEPGNRGLTLSSSDQMFHEVEAAINAGFQVCIHAIGDRANNITLNVYEKALTNSKIKNKDLRLRVEHAQVLSPPDIPRFSRLGVIPSMQPTHCTSDMYWAEKRLGAERLRGAYAWRSLISSGAIIPAGSDAPVESPDPLLGLYAAVTRQDPDGWCPPGWDLSERMSRVDAIKSYTAWGAFAGFQEHDKGKIAPGFWADLVAVSKDLMTIEPREILRSTVELTMIGGQIAFSTSGK
jgi:predicted amidohydrolase YtcJ